MAPLTVVGHPFGVRARVGLIADSRLAEGVSEDVLWRSEATLGGVEHALKVAGRERRERPAERVTGDDEPLVARSTRKELFHGTLQNRHDCPRGSGGGRVGACKEQRRKRRAQGAAGRRELRSAGSGERREHAQLVAQQVACSSKGLSSSHC